MSQRSTTSANRSHKATSHTSIGKTPSPHIPLDDFASDHAIIQEAQTHTREVSDDTKDDAVPISDRQLMGHIRTCLDRAGYRQIGNLDVNVQNGCVRLKGRVSKYYWRQLADKLIMGIDGVRKLESSVIVDS